ncbi:MAG: F0F1 ATP synthase subunit epsilon [Alphaproteobacteria bacterium]
MTNNLQFDLVSPERQLLSETVEMVVVPGMEGDFGVLVDHAPFISTLRPGVLVVTREGGAEERIFVRGGFADVTPSGLTVLAEDAVAVSDIDRADLDQRIKDASEDVADASSDDARMKAQAHLDALKELQAAA